MNLLIDDWSSFCENKAVFEDNYFFTLFMENVTFTEIKEIYKYFPNSEELIKRMVKFLFEEKPKIIDFNLKKNELEKLIKLDFEERKPILENIKIFTNYVSNINFVYLEDFESITTLILDDVWSQSFHDFMRTQKLITDKKVYELNNALYGITYDFDYQLYLFKPLLKTNYTVKNLFKFKQLGGVYAIKDNCVYFSFEK